MMSVTNLPHKAIVAITLLSLLLSNCIAAQQAQHNGHDQTRIEVYVSSREGDRLTRKENAKFSNDTKSSLPVITVDEGKNYQTIEGFGATFNEAGMVCLNS